MSKRKVQFQEQELVGDAKGSGSRRFKEKHSLDSDEEDDEKEEVMHEEDIEGKWNPAAQIIVTIFALSAGFQHTQKQVNSAWFQLGPW